MNQFSKIVFFLIPFFFSTALHGFCPEISVDFKSGYRIDKFAETMDVYRRSISNSQLFVLNYKDHIKIKKMHIWETGLQFCVNEDDWYLLAEGSYGWVIDGDYVQNRIDASKQTLLFEQADVDRGHTWNGTICTGYWFLVKDLVKDWDICWESCWPSLYIAPKVGWSYDRQHLKIQNNTNVLFNRLGYRNSWLGPYLGLDLHWQGRNTLLEIGYEYHWCHLHSRWKMHAPERIDLFSNRRKAVHAHGNILYINGEWQFDPCMYLGLGVKFQEWHAQNATIDPIDPEIEAELSNKFKLRHSRWTSLGVTIYLGYNF